MPDRSKMGQDCLTSWVRSQTTWTSSSRMTAARNAEDLYARSGVSSKKSGTKSSIIWPSSSTHPSTSSLKTSSVYSMCSALWLFRTWKTRARVWSSTGCSSTYSSTLFSLWSSSSISWSSAWYKRTSSTFGCQLKPCAKSSTPLCCGNLYIQLLWTWRTFRT